MCVGFTGTLSTDTICDDCVGETYSNGSFSSCKAHTKCEDMHLTEIKQGTHSSDAECGKSTAFSNIIIIVVTISVTGTIFLLAFVYIWMKKSTRSVNGGRENVKPYSSKLEDKVRQKNQNLEMVTVSSPLTIDSIHSEDTDKSKHVDMKNTA